MKNSLADFAIRSIGELLTLVKNRLKRMQFRPGLIIETGLDFHPP